MYVMVSLMKIMRMSCDNGWPAYATPSDFKISTWVQGVRATVAIKVNSIR